MISNLFLKIVPGRLPDLPHLVAAPSWHTSCPQTIYTTTTTMEDLVKRFDADVPRLTRKAFAMLKRDAKAEGLAMVERVTRVLVSDSDVSVSLTPKGVVVLTGGSMDSEQAACDTETRHDAYVVDDALFAPNAQHEPLLHRREIVRSAATTVRNHTRGCGCLWGQKHPPL